MSLEDELREENRVNPTTEAWVEQWVASLSPADKKTWTTGLANPNVKAAALFRVMRRHGFAGHESAVRRFVREYRDALG